MPTRWVHLGADHGSSRWSFVLNSGEMCVGARGFMIAKRDQTGTRRTRRQTATSSHLTRISRKRCGRDKRQAKLQDGRVYRRSGSCQTEDVIRGAAAPPPKRVNSETQVLPGMCCCHRQVTDGLSLASRCGEGHGFLGQKNTPRRCARAKWTHHQTR